MALRIEAIASYLGLKGIFKLLAADIYEVQSIEKALDELAPEGTGGECRDVAAADPRFTMRALQDLSVRIHQATSLDELLDSILAGLDETFGFHHSMILEPSEEPNVLVTIASRGYPENGVGAEARIGEGIIGVVAEARKPIRISGLLRAMLYAYAVAERRTAIGTLPARAHSAAGAGAAREPARGAAARPRRAGRRAVHRERGAVPLPRGGQGLHRGASAATSRLRSRTCSCTSARTASWTTGALAAAAASGPWRPLRLRPLPVARHEVTYYEGDEIVMVDGDYLIRSLPARILWKLLTAHQANGRTEFTNRELRLDKSLNLPEWKDNLESRLLLLRRRLDQKCPDIRLVPTARGRFALDLAGEVRLASRP